MGSCSLSKIITASSDKSFYKKFQKEFEEAREWHGIDPYSGTWATKSGVQIISSPITLPKRVTEKFKKEGYNKIWEYISGKADKYGPALAVKVGKDYLVGCWAPE